VKVEGRIDISKHLKASRFEFADGSIYDGQVRVDRLASTGAE
jgi:virulence-associated protein VapD